MAFDFRLPDLGEGVQEGEILRWLVGVGDEVFVDQPLVEVMTDKVTAELPSPVAGRVEAVCADEGEVVSVGAVLVSIAGVESEVPKAAVWTSSAVSPPASEPAGG